MHKTGEREEERKAENETRKGTAGTDWKRQKDKEKGNKKERMREIISGRDRAVRRDKERANKQNE